MTMNIYFNFKKLGLDDKVRHLSNFFISCNINENTDATHKRSNFNKLMSNCALIQPDIICTL